MIIRGIKVGTRSAVTVKQDGTVIWNPPITVPTHNYAWSPVTPNNRVMIPSSAPSVNLRSSTTIAPDTLLKTVVNTRRRGTVLEGPIYNVVNTVWWYRVLWDDVGLPNIPTNQGCWVGANNLVTAVENSAPVATSQTLAATVGTPLVITLAGTDADGDVLSYSVTINPTLGTLSGTGASRTYTPTQGGSDSFTFKVNDGVLDSPPAVVNVVVSPLVVPPPPNQLTKGVAVTGLSGTAGSQTFYTVAVPANATNLVVTLAGGSGDADLYIKFGSAPSTTVFDASSQGDFTTESVTISAPSAGTYHVMVNGYADYATVAIQADWTVGSSPPPTTPEGWTNYRSGISLQPGGVQGADFAAEYFYYDRIIDDSRVVYIKSATEITLSHNSLNVASNNGAESYSAAGANVGQIKFKVDGDQRFPTTNFDIRNWPSYGSPFSFNALNYGFFGAAGTSVVGATGGAGGAHDAASRATRYHRGMLDSVGDEWHTITVADDDQAATSNQEYSASDGRVWVFVVNPKTPCLMWRNGNGGQYYTTPPKKYFFPIIYDQTTYFTGDVSCEIRDINGNNVFYRINGGAWVSVGASSVILYSANFAEGSNTLEYYYAGNVAYTKTRTVVKNPVYPSAGESHGDRLWKSAALWESEVKPRINGDAELLKWKNFFRQSWTYNKENQISVNARKGYRSVAGESFENAFTARWEGMTFKNSGNTNTAADTAKLSLFETYSLLDPIGYELPSWPDAPIPVRESNYRGYYDVLPIYGHAATYDILAGYYRSDQGYANGLTPIQDFFIRDALARWVHMAQLCKAGYGPDGMWPAGHVSGAMVIAGMMPSYSTPYYGTCGLDGNTTVYPWTPFKDTNYTWKRLFFDNDIPVTDYPNCKRQLSINDRFTNAGVWLDRFPYAGTSLFGMCTTMSYNMAKLFTPNVTYPNLDEAMVRSAAESLVGSDGTGFRAWAGLQNSWFPTFRDTARPLMLNDYPWPASDSLGKQISEGRTHPFVVLHYNHNLP